MHAGTRQMGTLIDTMQNPESAMRIKSAEYFGYDQTRVDSYFTQINSVRDEISNAVPMKNVTDSKGEKVEYDQLKRILDDYTDSTKNMTYNELRSDMLNSFLKKSEIPNMIKNTDGRAYVAEVMSRHMMFRRLKKDVMDGNKDALGTLGSISFITGGSINDSTSTSVRDLATSEHMTFLHNEGMDYIRQAINNPGGDYSIESGDGNSIKFVNKNDPSAYSTLRLSRDKGESKWAVEYSVGLMRNASRGAQHLETASTRYGDVENMIQEYFDNQKDMLMKILSS